MITYRTGNILKDIDPNKKIVIAHGCNAVHLMGAGLAKQIKEKYIGAYIADTLTKKGDRNKLGTYSIYKHNDNLIILNCYTQFGIYAKKDVVLADYEAINNCFKNISRNYRGYEIHIPRIGCGLARGDWSIVESIIRQYEDTLDIVIYSYP